MSLAFFLLSFSFLSFLLDRGNLDQSGPIVPPVIVLFRFSLSSIYSADADADDDDDDDDRVIIVFSLFARCLESFVSFTRSTVFVAATPLTRISF